MNKNINSNIESNKLKPKKLMIFLLGLPLSGKSTMIKLIKEEFEDALVQNTGEYIRTVGDSEIQEFLKNSTGSEDLKDSNEVKQQIKISTHVQEHFVSNLCNLLDNDEKSFLIIDGFPRFSWQAEFIVNPVLGLSKIFNIKIIQLKNSEEKTNKNAEERFKLKPRSDDKIFQERIANQKIVLKGILDMLTSSSIELKTINTDLTIEESYKSISQFIKENIIK